MKIEIKYSEKIFRALYIIIMLVIVITAVFIILETSITDDRADCVGCIFGGSISEDGSGRSDYDDLSAVCNDMGLTLNIRENVSDNAESVAEAVSALAESKCRIIFIADFSYSKYVSPVSAKYPDIRFFVGDPKYAEKNVSFFGGREYQARYLSGIAAGHCTRTKVVGYVAPSQSEPVCLGLNAFVLGVQSVCPDAKVLVQFTSSGYRLTGESDSVELLRAENADVIAYHSTCKDVPDACEKNEVFFIGHSISDSKGYPHLLASIGSNRYKIFENALKKGMRIDERDATAFWSGVSDDAVYMNVMSDVVTDASNADIENAVRTINSGKDVYSDEIRDTKGRVRCADGEMIADKVLISEVYWLAEGVVVNE